MELQKNNIYLGDCLYIMPFIKDRSIDFILADPPFQKTQCVWDKVIDIKLMWQEYCRIIKDNGCIAIFGIEPFSSYIRLGNVNMYKYDYIWVKDKATNHLNAKKQPMRKTERISIFYKQQCTYNPQLSDKPKKNIRPPTTYRKNIDNYGSMDKKSKRNIPIDKSYPNELLNFRGCFGDKGKSLHPTQKPTDLLEYLIRTYTNEGDLVLDNCMGSGSTIVAAINTNRNYIGIEKDQIYFNLAKDRIDQVKTKF